MITTNLVANGYNWTVELNEDKAPWTIQVYLKEEPETVFKQIENIIIQFDITPKNLEAMNKGSNYLNIICEGAVNV